MKRWAMISGELVLTVVASATQPTTPGFTFIELAAGSAVAPGWRWDGSTFSEPERNRSITPKDFWKRFTAAEREALQNILSNGTVAQKNKLSAFRDYILIGGNVELDDDYIVASVNLMETAGILAAGRAAIVLTP